MNLLSANTRVASQKPIADAAKFFTSGCSVLTLMLSLSAALTGSLGAQEWTRFRGPQGSGQTDTNVPTDWDATDFNWTAKLPGIGHSAPVIWADRVFVSSANPDTATQHMIAIDRNSGEVQWEREFQIESYKIHGRNSFASNSPAVDAEQLYVAWSTPAEATLTALDHKGQTVWQQQFGSYSSSHGFATSPVVYKDLVILCLLQRKPGPKNGPAVPTSQVVACNRTTGEIVWSTTRMSEVASYATPIVLERDGHRPELIGCSTSEGIYSLDLESGDENWSLPVFDKRTVSSPVYAAGLLFGSTGSGGGGNYVAAIHPGPNPKLAYEVRRQAPYVPTLVGKDELIFLWSDDGIITCLEAESGKKVWTKRVDGNYSGSPIVAGDAIYCIDEAGVVRVVATERKYKLLSSFDLGEPSRSTPAVADGRIYFRTESQLFSLGSK